MENDMLDFLLRKATQVRNTVRVQDPLLAPGKGFTVDLAGEWIRCHRCGYLSRDQLEIRYFYCGVCKRHMRDTDTTKKPTS